MSVLWLVLQRMGYAVALLVAVLVLNFTLIHLAPGDIADTIAGDMGGADPQVMAEIRQIYGLDRPVWEQFFQFIWNAFQLDFGHSFFFSDLLAIGLSLRKTGRPGIDIELAGRDQHQPRMRGMS